MPELALMTYNMLHAPGDRAELLAKVVESRRPDVVAVQEVADPAALNRMAASIGYWMFLGPCNAMETSPLVPTTEAPRPEHLAFLTRRPLAAAMVHQGDPEVMFRPVLEGRLRVDDGPARVPSLRLLTVHLRAFPGPAAQQWKMREVSVVRAVAGDGARLTVVLGDFNAYVPQQAEAFSDTATWPLHLPQDHRDAVMGGVLRSLLDAGYHDALSEAPGGPVCGGTLRGSDRPRVDHVLVSADLTPCLTAAEIVRTGAPVEEASDHFPVVVRLRVDGPA
jgi:endonuclease/exonuclease/phosphatase family metal-dependent hydrolase